MHIKIDRYVCTYIHIKMDGWVCTHAQGLYKYVDLGHAYIHNQTVCSCLKLQSQIKKAHFNVMRSARS